MAKNHMQEIPVWLKRSFVTLVETEDIIVPIASVKCLLEISTLLHPMNSLKSAMRHYPWTPLILDRGTSGMS